MTRAASDRFLERLGRLDRGDLLAIQAAWSSRPADRLAAAREAALAVAGTAGLRDDLLRVERSVRDWAARAGPVTGLESGTGTLAEADVEARRRAGPALVDVAVGLLLAERLDDEARELLAGPYHGLSGPPEVPV